MQSLNESLGEYRKQLQKGTVQKAYRGLMAYIMALRTAFAERHPEYAVSGSIYYGYMDMTYFAFAPAALRGRRLKIAIVFLHEACRFEAWLAAANRQVQSKYWRLIKDSGWDKYRLVPALKGADSIIESVLVGAPDFNDPDVLTKEIERGALKFARDVESFLAAY